MEGRKLILADGTEYSEGEAGYSEGHLWLYLLPSTDFARAFADFNDAEKTDHIAFVFGESRVEYEHFTDLRGIMRDADGQVTVHLARPNREEG